MDNFIKFLVALVLLVFIFALGNSLLSISDSKHTVYNRGLIAGFALAVCPNVNQEIIRQVQRGMLSIEHCSDLDKVGF